MIVSEEAYLAHHGILGMHWGHRRAQINYTKEPEGASIKRQSNVLRAKYNLKKAKGSTAKKIARKDLVKAEQILKDSVKEYRDFEDAMHKKVGKTSKIKTVNSNGKLTYVNKKGEKIKKFELEGASNYELRKKIQRGQRISNASLLAIGAYTMYELATLK